MKYPEAVREDRRHTQTLCVRIPGYGDIRALRMCFNPRVMRLTFGWQ